MIMIRIEVTDRVDHDVSINILRVTRFIFIKVDSKVCRIYFYNRWFLERVSEVVLKKMYFTSKMWRTNIQFDLAKQFNRAHKS